MPRLDLCSRFRLVAPRRPLVFACALLLVTLLGVGTSPGDSGAASPRERLAQLPPERPDDPPGIPARVSSQARAAASVSFGRFTHVQVNVAPGGANIVGDAANEPSIAVDPTNHDRMAIGWRQFDTITSNFRQAGYGYTTDGGATWTAGKIEAGIFRSDPVLGADATGKFLYNSLSLPGNVLTAHVFPSTDGGASWGTKVYAYGGDKQWMTIDRTGGEGDQHVYQAWSTASNPWGGNTFNRSIDDAASFQLPSDIPFAPVWGTLDVASDGTLYVVGTDGPGGSTFVSTSTDAKNALVTPTFTTVSPDLGGSLWTGPPNPAGLLGQLWIGVDRSGGPRDGWIYVLASVATPTDPLDVNFIRSTDGGVTWSAPVRVNDDPAGNGAWQWFGTMSVAPDGRIEAVWNDSRPSGDSTLTALFYSYSNDGGTTWTVNEQASPVWNSMLGFPNQAKIGDYYHMVSDLNGADLAWAATFTGGEDVYYTRIPRGAVSVSQGDRPGNRLHGVAPNPFTNSTTIRFDVPAGGARVKLEVFDVRGHRVAVLADGFTAGGTQSARWFGRDAQGRPASPGIYFCRYEAAGRAEARKLMLVR